jgi:DNA-binding NarL/FixJ family response regulator
MESKDSIAGIESKFEGRDLEIIRGIANGKSFVDIAEELNVSRQYITKHFADKIKPRLARMMA